MLGVRAALALEGAHERAGEQAEVVRLLGVLVEATRGPQRSEAQKRLGMALLRAGNDEEAFPALEKSLFTDAGDEPLRGAYRQAGARLGRLADVARGLLRCAGTTRSPELKVRLHLEAGEVLLEAGEAKKAQAPLQVAADSGEPPVRLAALRLLERVTEDPSSLAGLLARLADAEDSEEARAEVNARRGGVLQGAGEAAKAIDAWRGALAGATRGRAEAALAALYEETGAWSELIALLVEQGERQEGEGGRGLLERAAELRQSRLGDAAGALAAWDAIVRRHGRTGETDRRRRELLERLGRHAELVAELVAESATGAAEARAGLWGIVAQLRLERLGDAAGALAACQSALALVPGEEKAAAVAGRLLEGPGRLAAATALEPLYREQAEFWGLVRVLEVLGQESPEPARRLVALGEAVELVASDDPQRALRLTQEGLRLSLGSDLEATPEWLVRLELLSGAIEGPGAHAELLLAALGARGLSHPALVDLARRAAASLVEAGRSAEGLALLERVFEADPRRLDAAPSLDRLLTSRGDTAARAALWRAVLRHEQGKDARVDALRLLASLARQQGDRETEAGVLGELLALEPEDTAARDALIEALRGLGRSKDLADLLLRELPRARDAEGELGLLLALLPLASDDGLLARFEEARGATRFPWSSAQNQRLLVACARSFAADPGRQEHAAAAYRALIEQTRSPEHLASYEAALGAWPRGERWREERRWVLAWRAENDADRGAAVQAWAQAEEELGDERAAVELYRRLLVLDPGSEAARSRLVPLLLHLGDVEGARGALLARRARARDGERRQLDLELASLLVERSRRFEEGLGVLEPLLGETPGDEDALRLVEQIHQEALAANEEGLLRRTEEALEHAVEVLQDAERARRLLERLLAGGGEPERRRGWFQGLLTRTGDPAEGLRVLLRAVAEAPQDEDLWDQAEQAARRLGQPGELLEAYRTHLDNPAVAAAIGQRAIDFYEEWFEEPEGVVALVERVLLADVGARWAFDRLKVFYGADERWGELLALYDRMIGAARRDEDRLVFLEDAVEIARDFSGDDGRAIHYLERLVALRPEDEASLAALERLYERNHRHQALVALLSRQLSRGEGEPSQRLRGRIAALWLEGVGDPAQAFAVIQQMLAVDPEDPEALALLERLLSTFQRPAPGASLPDDVAAAYQGAAASLKSRYQQEGRAEELARVIEIELEGASSDEARARLLRQLIELRLGKINDPAGAFEDTSALLAILPGDTAVLRDLCALAERTGQQQRLLDLLDRLAREQPAEAPSLLLEGARVAERLLRQPELALPRYGQAIEAARKTGAPGGVALVAAQERAALLRGLPGKEHPLFDALAEHFALEPTLAARASLPAAMAALARGVLNDPALLARAWELRLADAPDDLDALSGLVEAYTALARWSELVPVLRRRARVTSDTFEQHADRVRAARLLDEQLGDAGGALEVWEELRERFGDEASTLDPIAVLLERLERFEALVSLLRGQIPGAKAERKATLLERLGDVERLRRRGFAEAVRAYAGALVCAPSSGPALAGLEALTAEPSVRAEAVGALLEHFQRRDDAEGILSLLERRLSLAEDDDGRGLILLEAAALQEEKLGRVGDAFRTLCRALALGPSDLGLARETLRAARGAKALTDGVEALRRAAEDPRAARIARDLWLLVAEALRLVDEGRADEAYERALALGEDTKTLQALVELRRGPRGVALVDALLRLASALHGSPPLLLEAGRVALDELKDPARGGEIARQILDQAAASPLGWSPWEPSVDWAVAALTGDGPARVAPALQLALLKQAADLPCDAPRKVSFLRRSAALCEDDLQDKEGALRCFQQILVLTPEDPEALDQMARIYRQLGRREDLLRVLQRQVERCLEPAARSELRLDLARLLRDTGDIDAAIRALREALAETPEREEISTLLGELYEATGQLRELASLLEARAEGAVDAAPAADLWAQAAALAEARLKDTARATSAHRKAAALGRAASLAPLARLLLLRREYVEATSVLETLAAPLQGPERSAALASLAEAYAAQDRKDDARHTLELALPEASDPGPLQARLILLYREAGAWERLAELMVAEARGSSDTRLRATRLREAAELLLEHNAAASAAVPLLREAAGLAPEDVAVQLVLGESLRLAGELEDAAVVLRRLVDSYKTRRPKERALAHLQLGLLLHAAKDGEGAFGELDAAARIDPAHPRILQTLGRIAMERGELERAQKALRSLLLLLPRGARSEHGVSRVEVQLSLADIARKQGDGARADELLETTLAHARESEDDWAMLDAYLRENGFHAPLARSVEMRLGAAREDEQLRWLRELTSLYLYHLDQPAAALERARRALALAPERHELRQLAVEAARASSELPSLVAELGALATELAAASPGVAAELWIELADLLERDLQDAAGARGALEQAEQCAAASPEATSLLPRVWPRLEGLLRGAGDRDAQIALLLRRREHAPPGAERAEPTYRLAALLLSPPGDPAKALDFLHEGLRLEPQIERASGLLQQALAAHGDDERVLRACERFAREQGRTGELIDALTRLGALPGVGTAPLREAAEISMQIGEERSADAILREISELDQNPSSLPDVIWALVTLASRVQGRGDASLAASLKERAAELADGDQRRALLLDVAALAQGPLVDNGRAARIYEALLDDGLLDAPVWRPLAAIYRSTEDDARLIALLERLLALVDGPTRAELRGELIEVLLQDPSTPGLRKAIALLQDALSDTPDDLALTERLAALLERAGDQQQLVGLLERQLDGARDRGEHQAAAALALRLGGLSEALAQEARATEFYRVGLDLDPVHTELLRALLKITERRDDSFETAELLERLLRLEKGPPAAALASRLAALHEANWNPESAERALELGYEAHPDPALRDQLAERYTEGASWGKLAALYTRDAAAQPSHGARITSLRKAAEVQRKQLNNPEAAADLLQQALSLAPADRPVLQALLDALTPLASPSASRRAVDALTFALEHRAQDPELLRLRGELQGKTGAFDAALADLEASVAAGHAAAAPLLRSTLAAAIVSMKTPATLRPWRLRLAGLLLEDKDPEGARAQLEAASRDEPSQPEVLRALVALERQEQRWDALLGPLKALASRVEGPELLATTLELADAAGRAGKPAEARAALERALRSAPGDARLRAALRGLYEQLGARRELAQLLREDAESLREPGPRFEALLAAARLLIDPQQGDPRLAAQILEEARALRPDDLELALLLAETQVEARRPRDAIQGLDRAATAHRGRRSKALGQVHLRKARIELSLGERPSALVSMSKAFDNDGGNGALAMELGLLALEMNDEQTATRAFRAISLLKVTTSGDEGTTAATKAQAYYQLSLLALGQADRRKARLLVEKAIAEDPSLEAARQLRDELVKNG
jgi:tetratricopeptide (TPR) repeat protein